MLIYRLRYYTAFILRHHAKRLIALPLFGALLAALTLHAGDAKASVHWGDVAGEGLSCILALTWIVLLLCARPAGRVTQWLFAGALCYWGFTCLDLLDEFISYPSDSRLFQNLESFSAPLAMLLLTVGLFNWLKEQALINRQLRSRENFHRDHQLIDPLTNAYTARHFQQQLALACDRETATPLFLALIELDQLRDINRTLGMNRGDQLLQGFAEAMLAHLTGEDSFCRLGGNRFALLIPHQDWHSAQGICQQLLENASRVIASPVTSVSLCRLSNESAEAFFARALRQLPQTYRHGAIKDCA
ncbi:GGDEF domain-containing protein [Simiduia curdlanivorans]|uniref:diguanylate cyclase n=1 Tax=Simiduia curdlanivorans TaxID=1492769 RepID=A0ABV8V8C7_9GAMM|nr:GGDEF domain-containing protein [Simiduia curdlanivorans]MDN3639501.1 GGDEF domain-containing protein [Simiduia curdlanivorans]